MRWLLFALLPAGFACHAGTPQPVAATAASSAPTRVVGVDTLAEHAAPQAPALSESVALRGLYVNRFAAQSPAKMRSLIALADSTEINAFVIDMKDEFGLNFEAHDSVAKKYAGR